MCGWNQEIIADYNREKDRVTIEETDSLAGRVYDFVWQRSAAGAMFVGAA